MELFLLLKEASGLEMVKNIKTPRVRRECLSAMVQSIIQSLMLRPGLTLKPTASFDINSLIPRDTYSISVTSAPDMDGIQIAPNSAYTFTVDYAGAIGDTTPPLPPLVKACGAASPDTISASWSAHDPDSTITLYRYAIGASPGGTDVVNWTNTSGTSFLRSGLSLTPGQTYYVSVKARNEGGLWSEGRGEHRRRSRRG